MNRSNTPLRARRKTRDRDNDGSWTDLARSPLVPACVGALALFYLLFFRGSSQPLDLVGVHPARGLVFCDGKPLAQAAIRLHPIADKGDFPKPQALSQQDGSFALGTYKKDDGVPPGEYRVTVHWFEKLANEEERRPRNLLPIRYTRPETSGLTVRIGEGENALPPLTVSWR